ncbi:hypothetical protein H6P81_006625 [Aristolochia fimbriata]|uniref:ABC-2 type transporter transmembrane domain-containing protein n=1 Tax=Aristolochia fimbriata TaxID=158543 RepID=A0AAV7F1J2_ARIFI|nr:hypothetical protein H6P81_006625 [Aristolochia fimbriata]
MAYSASAMSTYANPLWVENAVLTKRSATNTRRMPELFRIRFGAVLVTGFILATIFWKLNTSPRGSRNGSFLHVRHVYDLLNLHDALLEFLKERYIFMSETACNAYRSSSHVLSNLTVSLPSLSSSWRSRSPPSRSGPWAWDHELEKMELRLSVGHGLEKMELGLSVGHGLEKMELGLSVGHGGVGYSSGSNTTTTGDPEKISSYIAE